MADEVELAIGVGLKQESPERRALERGLDLSRQRAVIKTLMSVRLESPGRGPRRPFDPATVKVTWKKPDAV